MPCNFYYLREHFLSATEWNSVEYFHHQKTKFYLKSLWDITFFCWLASTWHILASEHANLKSCMCSENYSKRSFQWNRSHPAIFIEMESREEIIWLVKWAQHQFSPKRHFSDRNLKLTKKKFQPIFLSDWTTPSARFALFVRSFFSPSFQGL